MNLMQGGPAVKYDPGYKQWRHGTLQDPCPNHCCHSCIYYRLYQMVRPEDASDEEIALTRGELCQPAGNVEGLRWWDPQFQPTAPFCAVDSEDEPVSLLGRKEPCGRFQHWSVPGDAKANKLRCLRCGTIASVKRDEAGRQYDCPFCGRSARSACEFPKDKFYSW